MRSSLSNVVNNLPKGIDNIKYKYKHDNKKCETCGIKCKEIAFLNTKNLKMI